MANSNPKNVRNFTSILRAGGILNRGRRLNGIAVINKTGSNIASDKLVAVSGYDVTSKLPKVVLADADSAGLATDLFVALGGITNGKTGNVYKGGTSEAALNTNFGTVGDPVYLDVTAGGFTGTLPTAANSVVQIVGYTMVKSATVGQIAWDIGPVTKGSDQSTNSDFKVLAATQTYTSSTVLTTLTGFSWTLQGGATYVFDINLPCTMTTNGGLAVALKYTTASAASIQLQYYQSTAADATTAASAQSTTTTDATRYVDNKTAAYILTTLKGSLVVGATAGSVAVQTAQNTSNTDTTSVLLGSYSRFTRVA